MVWLWSSGQTTELYKMITFKNNIKLQKRKHGQEIIQNDWLKFGFRHLASKIHRWMDTRQAKGITVPKLAIKFKFLTINN